MQVYLLEDALELWEATLRATPAPVPQQLLDLVPFLLPCVDFGTLTLRRVLAIIESYVLLAPREMIDLYRTPLFDAFSVLLGTLKPEANSIVTHVVEIVIRAAQALGGDHALAVVGNELLRSSFLSQVFDGIGNSHEAHSTSGPNKKYSSLDAVVLTDYFSVLARMVLAGTSWWVDCVGRVAEGRGRGEGVEGVMAWVLEEWFRHVSVLPGERWWERCRSRGVDRVGNDPRRRGGLLLIGDAA